MARTRVRVRALCGIRCDVPYAQVAALVAYARQRVPGEGVEAARVLAVPHLEREVEEMEEEKAERVEEVDVKAGEEEEEEVGGGRWRRRRRRRRWRRRWRWRRREAEAAAAAMVVAVAAVLVRVLVLVLMPAGAHLERDLGSLGDVLAEGHARPLPELERERGRLLLRQRGQRLQHAVRRALPVEPVAGRPGPRRHGGERSARWGVKKGNFIAPPASHVLH